LYKVNDDHTSEKDTDFTVKGTNNSRINVSIIVHHCISGFGSPNQNKGTIFSLNFIPNSAFCYFSTFFNHYAGVENSVATVGQNSHPKDLGQNNGPSAIPKRISCKCWLASSHNKSAKEFNDPIHTNNSNSRETNNETFSRTD